MFTQVSQPTLKHLENLTNPGIAGRLLELFTGSTRRDVLHAIQTSVAGQWEAIETPTPHVTLDHPNCRASFAFAPMKGAKKGQLEALSLNVQGESLVLQGTCDMAQAILKSAQRRLVVLTGQEKQKALTLFREVLGGSGLEKGCSCTYEHRTIHDHDSAHSNEGWVKTARFNSPHGTIELHRELRNYQIKGKEGQEMLARYVSAYIALDTARSLHQGQASSSYMSLALPGDTQFGASSSVPVYLSDLTLPPRPYGAVDVASATFEHASLEPAIAVLQGPKADVLVQLNRKHIERALGAMKEFATLSSTNEL